MSVERKIVDVLPGYAYSKALEELERIDEVIRAMKPESRQRFLNYLTSQYEKDGTVKEPPVFVSAEDEVDVSGYDDNDLDPDEFPEANIE